MTCLSINSQFSQFTYDQEGNLLVTFKVSGRWDKEKALQIDKEKFLELKVKEQKNNRTIQQNKLLWELIGLVADKTHNDKEMIYDVALKRAGVQVDYICVSNKVNENVLRETFKHCERLNDIEHTNSDGSKVQMAMYRVYFGSSGFDTKEMTRLVDEVQLMCSEVGICVNTIQ